MITTLERKVKVIEVELLQDEDCSCPDDSRVITVYEVAYFDERRRNDPGPPVSTALFRTPAGAESFAKHCKEPKITPRSVTTRQFTVLRQTGRLGEY